jgi:pyruvate dehydrogenase E2 component (dihydrolipoamide acetyltransferase)
MPIEILMPALSPTMKEGNLAKWVKKEGDKIKAGEVIAEIETDKATMEVEAVDAGILGKIIIQEGTENVAVNSLIALILENGEDKAILDNYKSIDSNNTQAIAENTAKEPLQKQDLGQDSGQDLGQNPEPIKKEFINSENNQDYKIKASPLAKRIASEKNISLQQLVNAKIGSGPNGRIVKDDILLFASNNKNFSNNNVARNPQETTIIKNNNIRKVIAKRLLESKQNVPHFYLSCELDITKMLEIRSILNKDAEQNSANYKISVNDFIIKACALALKKVPNANSSWTEESIILYNNIDISVAVAIDGGLITPIIRNADQKNIVDISNEMKQLAKKARDGKLQPEEFQGGSFSISNLGMYGIDNFSAIINPPQSCILAVSRAVRKPIVGHNSQIIIADTMNITLSCDHRVVDGAVAAEFLKALRYYIENPVLNLTN